MLRHNVVEEFITPIVKVSKGGQKVAFYSLPEYRKWMEETPHSHTWTVKYYKGRGRIFLNFNTQSQKINLFISFLKVWELRQQSRHVSISAISDETEFLSNTLAPLVTIKLSSLLPKNVLMIENCGLTII